MIRDLTIQGYRCFKGFHVDGLARVNLIVGQNNSGKTSLLEAIYLLARQGIPQTLIEVLFKRGEIIQQNGGGEKRTFYRSNYQPQHIYHGYEPKVGQSIKVLSNKEDTLGLDIALSLSRRIDVQTFKDLPAFSIKYLSGESFVITVDEMGDMQVIPANEPSYSFTPPKYNHHYITTSRVNLLELGDLWSEITLTTKEEAVIQSLQILDQNVERLAFSTKRDAVTTGVLLKLKSRHEPVSLSSMGDGMRRILTLAISAVTSENGVLLVDEVDTGLYYNTQFDMWRLLIETAQRLNVQIFATTHSLDCVRAFQEALSQSSDPSSGLLFRLSLRDKTEIHPVLYNADDLAIAIHEDIEVR
ncbi:MAG: AAA family ATPase [Chloroflexi bacterium]|nr:AAA family ATPase [Chloroflexota bacterium]MBI5714049.1 AAA family ATPase [Chloroflexota bacterium]